MVLVLIWGFISSNSDKFGLRQVGILLANAHYPSNISCLLGLNNKCDIIPINCLPAHIKNTEDQSAALLIFSEFCYELFHEVYIRSDGQNSLFSIKFYIICNEETMLRINFYYFLVDILESIVASPCINS